MYYSCYFFFKQKTAYEMRISDWSSDVCSSDLRILYLELPAKRRGKLTDEAQPEPEAKRGRFKARGKARRRRVVKRLGVPSGKRGWTREENPDRIALAGTDAIGHPFPRPRRAHYGREQPPAAALPHLLAYLFPLYPDLYSSLQPLPPLSSTPTLTP